MLRVDQTSLLLGLLHGAYNYTGCYPRQVVFRRRSIRRTGSEPIVVNDRLPRGQQVITSHLLFRITPQHVAVLQPRIGPLCRELQISYHQKTLASYIVIVIKYWSSKDRRRRWQQREQLIPTFVDELDRAAAYIELHQFRVLTIVGYTLVLLILIGMPIATVG